MDPIFQALADPSRRRIVEALRVGPATAGQLAELFPIARPGVSRHLRVLRDAGLVAVEPDAQRRVYRLRPDPLVELDRWLGGYRDLWTQRMDALQTEISRGKRQRRLAGPTASGTASSDQNLSNRSERSSA